MTGPGLAKAGSGVEWWDWKGAEVTENEREAFALTLAASDAPLDARTFLTGDMMLVVVPEPDGSPPNIYDCVVRRRGRVQP